MIPEKPRVVEPRAQHPFVALAHQAIGIGIGVHHRDEMRCKLALGILHRQIFLMMPHHRNQDLMRQVEIAAIEAPENRGRELGDVDQRVEQIRIGLGSQALPGEQRQRYRTRFFSRRSTADKITPFGRNCSSKFWIVTGIDGLPRTR